MVPSAVEKKQPSGQERRAPHSNRDLAAGSRRRRPAILLASLLVVIAGAAAYSNSLHCGFVFDDIPGVLDNATIRNLGSLGKVLSPPGGGSSPVQGRPVVNVSLAINYALGGTNVFGYHLFNLTVHLLAALTLMGVVRRTIAETAPCRLVADSALGISTAVAVIWTVHPLLTEAVTQVVQRAESMVGLFYLLTLYCVIRGSLSRNSARWYRLAVAACALGMGTKEVMVTAPAVVLAYDAVFLAGSWREALRRRRSLYVGLAATWLVLGYALVTNNFSRGTAAGFGGGVTPWQYMRTQCWAILHYLKLSVLPHPLILDYGEKIVQSAAEIVPGAAMILILGSATILALRRVPWLGFLGVWFFAILAPSSSFVPLAAQTVAEKRMYLPLAAVIAALVLGVALAWRRLEAVRIGDEGWRRAWRRVPPVAATAAAVIVLAYLSHERNLDYRDNLTIWRDTAIKMPDNKRAENNLGCALMESGRVTQALDHLERAVALDPGFADAHLNLALAQGRLGRLTEALASARRAVELNPDASSAEETLGEVLARLGRWDEVLEHARAYLARAPDSASANALYGTVLTRMGRTREGQGYLARARALDPSVPLTPVVPLVPIHRPS